jgi:hypothetical protein
MLTCYQYMPYIAHYSHDFHGLLDTSIFSKEPFERRARLC